MLTSTVAFRLRDGRSETVVRPRHGRLTGSVLVALGVLAAWKALSVVRTGTTLSPGGVPFAALFTTVIWALFAFALVVVGYWFLVGVTVLSFSDASVSVEWKAPLAPSIQRASLRVERIGRMWAERYTLKHRGGRRPFWKLMVDNGGSPTTLLSGLTMEDAERILEGPLRQFAVSGQPADAEGATDARDPTHGD